MNTNFKLCSEKVLTAALITVMSVSFIPTMIGNDVVEAAEIPKNYLNTRLCTTGISNPSAPDISNYAWKGNYVYYGKYDDKPIKFRVYYTNETKFGGSTLFLDCDSILYRANYDSSSAKWVNSDIRQEINGTFAEKAFTKREYSAIASSRIASYKYSTEYGQPHYNYVEGLEDQYTYTTALTGEKLFFLDTEDLTDERYGTYYSQQNGQYRFDWIIAPKCMAGTGELSDELYWMRTWPQGYRGAQDSVLVCDGTGSMLTSVNYPNGVSPAMNIDRKSIVLNTDAGSDAYKLTIKDSNMKIAIQEDKNSLIRGSVYVPYTISGANSEFANRVSVLILDKQYTAGNTNDANIIYYEALNETYGLDSTGSFDLPEELDVFGWGKDYFVYILAEDVNDSHETDYASEPLLLDAPDGWYESEYIYYFDNGKMVKGWKKIDGDWYYFDSNGHMSTGWDMIAGKWYFFSDDGTAQADMFMLSDDGVNYRYINEKFFAVTGWNKINDLFYYFDEDGLLLNDSGWQFIGDNWYFLEPDEQGFCYAITDWRQLGGVWYYFDLNGKMASGWCQISDEWYYFDQNGHMCSTSWVKINNTWYYFKNDVDGHSVMVTGWVLDNGIWYYLKPNGAMATGWVQVGNTWYYLESSGAMKTGWLKSGNTWYFMNDNGSMATGWKLLGGVWYYFDANGSMVTGSKTINGKTYYFDESGHCTNP